MRGLLIAMIGAVAIGACAATPAPVVAPPRRAQGQPPTTGEARAAVATTVAAPAAGSDSGPGAPAESPVAPIDVPAVLSGGKAPGPRRLAWVNPSRCVTTCAFSPGDALVRVNDRAVADARGTFQVEGAALTALRELLAAARAAGHGVKISSAFRPYDEQARLFRTTKEKGRAARPGHSEHQLGTTIDLRLPTTRAIDWLAAHAGHYGSVLSYPPGKQRTTGYRPEPWHVRFVGRDISAQVPVGSTLEELFRRDPDLAESGSCADCPAATSRASCGSLTTEGTCEGTVLIWCYDGARNAIDCAAFGNICTRAGGGSLADCVPDPHPAPPQTSAP